MSVSGGGCQIPRCVSLQVCVAHLGDPERTSAGGGCLSGLPPAALMRLHGDGVFTRGRGGDTGGFDTPGDGGAARCGGGGLLSGLAV